MRTPHSRRPAAPNPNWGTGRERLLQAARELFVEKPYTSVGTKEIAERAGVSEPMVFRHFGSKALLFKEAVLAPFNAFMAQFIADWEGRDRGTRDPVDEARTFYTGLYTVLAENRPLILTLVAAEAARGPLPDTETDLPQLGAILERFEKVLRWEGENRPFRPLDPAVMTRLMFGLVMSIAVHGDWMYSGASTPVPDPAVFIDEMAILTIHGTLQRP